MHGDIHRALKGARIEYCATNGHLLVIRCEDGKEVRVAWVDDNGQPMSGTPVLQFLGSNIIAKPKGQSFIQHRHEAGL